MSLASTPDNISVGQIQITVVPPIDFINNGRLQALIEGLEAAKNHKTIVLASTTLDELIDLSKDKAFADAFAVSKGMLHLHDTMYVFIKKETVMTKITTLFQLLGQTPPPIPIDGMSRRGSGGDARGAWQRRLERQRERVSRAKPVTRPIRLCKTCAKKKHGFRCCLATSHNSDSKLYQCFSIPYFYIAFCGYDRIIEGLGFDSTFFPYPFCGGCNLADCNKPGRAPVIELPCCIACLIWPIFFPFVWFMSYVSNFCSAGWGCEGSPSVTEPGCCNGTFSNDNYCFCCCGCCIGNDANEDTITPPYDDGITSCFNCCGVHFCNNKQYD